MIIILNGPCGVGKTTTAERLNMMLDRSVMLDGDYLGQVNPFEIYSEARIDHLYATFQVNIAHHQQYEYEHFIINYVFESETSLKDLMRRVQPLSPDIFVFRLYVSEEENERRICQRATDAVEWELNRCKVLSAIMEPFGDGIGERLDVTELTVDEVANLILTKVEQYSQQQLRRMNFHERYIDWIYLGQKKSTTRLIRKSAESVPFKAGDLTLATNEENNLAFAILRIDAVEERGWLDLDEELARSENFASVVEFRETLKSFYPEVSEMSRFTVCRFTCVHYLDHKLQAR